MGYVNFNISDELKVIERQRREIEDNFHKKEIDLYNTFLNFKLNFGKYNGKTIKEVLDIDEEHIRWLLTETDRTGIKINSIDLSKIIVYYENVKQIEACKRESESKDSQVQTLINNGAHPNIAYNIVYNRF